MTTCPQCGRQTSEGAFCERCGAPLSETSPRAASEPTACEAPTVVEREVPRPSATAIDVEERLKRAEARIRSAESRIEREVDKIDLYANQRGEPTLEYDRICSLFENTSGILRFRFDPMGGGSQVENVSIVFSNAGCESKPALKIRRADRKMEYMVQFPPQPVGLQSWDVQISYDSASRKHELAGQLQVFVRPVESRKRGSDNFNININTNIGDVGHASDVTVNQRGVEGLEKLVAASDPYAEMNRIMSSDERNWVSVPLSDDNAVVSLPPMPSAARVDTLLVDFGNRRIRFFAGRTVTFGRARELNDIVLRPPAGSDEGSTMPYRVVSREHCFFEHAGEAVVISDGRRDVTGVVRPSTGGTYWNDEPVRSAASLPLGETGIVSFGKPACAKGLSMEAKACAPTKACATCPHSNIRWCGEGKHPSLMLTRRDGIAERIVALWSCFCLGEADPSYENVIIFRKDGGFAFRDGSRSGWLVPGTTIQTDFGEVKIL